MPKFDSLLIACRALLLFVAASPLAAQDGPYSFVHYGTEQGLSNDFITDVIKDRQGFLWIGTTNGLNRFDGRRFRVFKDDPKNPTASPGDYIVALANGPDGWLWVSSNKGLHRLDPQRLKIEQVVLPTPKDTANDNKTVCKARFDRQGRAWVSDHAAIYCVDIKTGKVQTYTHNLGKDWSYPTYVDRYNTVWFMVNSRLYRLDPATGRYDPCFIDSARTTPMILIDILEDSQNNLWFLTWNNGLYRYDRPHDRIELFSTKVGLVRRMLPDTTSAGRPFFWFGGGGTGLFLFFPDNQSFLNFRNDSRDPFTHNGLYATCFYKDEHSGDVWIGTELGLQQYAPAAVRFGRMVIPEEFTFGPYNMVSGIAPDRTDSSGTHYFVGVWANSLFRWDRSAGKFQHLKCGPKFPLVSDEVFSIFSDRDGFVWVTMAGGISRYDPRGGRLDNWRIRFRQPKRNNKIICGLQDKQGRYWFGANAEGLYRFDRATRQPVHVDLPPEVLHANGDVFIHQIAADSAGRLWLATNTGLTRYTPANGETRRYGVPGLPEKYDCPGVAISKTGQVWITAGKYVVELDTNGQVRRRLGPEQGMRCTRGFFILEDQQGKIWFNSDYLLHCFDPIAGTFTYYGLADGLFSNAPTDGLDLMPNGEIMVGFPKAFNYFHPARLRRNTAPPPVVITAIKVLDKEQDPEKPLVLYPGQNMLSVEFAALNFSQPERNRYAYKLDGFDRDWNYTDRPVAIYTNLDGGRYTLRLKAANNDGVWNETGASLSFQVVPPIYERWYFYLGLVALGAGIVYAIARYRYLQRRRLDVFRERLARDLHDEMGSTLSSIRFFSDFAQTQVAAHTPQTLPVLQRISQSATALSESMQDIIWAMKSPNDRLEDLASRMTEFGLRLLEARGIHFKTSIDERFPLKHLSPEQRRNLYLIFKEAINNAAKYARCTEVELVFRSSKDGLHLAVIDNGTGFDTTSEEAGNGLHNMRQRAAEIGGRLLIQSAPGQGTRVEFTG